ncbi:MAG: helix-turn-helix transcriptional regulator [Blastococcus sp.]
MLQAEQVHRLELATSDVLCAHEAIRDTFAGHRLTIRGSQENFTYRQATASAGELAVDTLRHTMRVEEDVDPVEDTWIGLVDAGQLRVDGVGEETRSLPGDVLLFPQGGRFTCGWRSLDLRMVRLPTRIVAELAAARTGLDPADFRFESMSPLSVALGEYCRTTVHYLHSLFRGDPMVGDPLVLRGALDLAAAAALATFPSTVTTAAPVGPAGHATPAALRRSAAFIDEHAHEPLTLADIVRASGIGARALQQAFRRHHDTTPTGYLRNVRLERAHRELQAADPTRGATVAAVAARWGFPHPGRFAVLYRRTYGRSPRQTLLS